MTNIEVVEPGNAPRAIRQIARLITSEVFEGHIDPEDYAEDLAPNTTYGLFADDGKLLGAATTRHNQEHFNMPQVTELRAMAVDPHERPRGYGTLLLQHVAKMAIEQGDGAIMLLPMGGSEIFYRKFGFEWTNEQKDFMIVSPQTLLGTE